MYTPKTALGRLWANACSQVKLRHPSPRCAPYFTVEYDGSYTSIRLNLPGLPDNDNPDVTLRDTFGFSMKVRTWPGMRLAKEYLLAAWVAMQRHDSLEQCLDAVTGRRIVDPHDHWGHGDEANAYNFGAVTDGRIKEAVVQLMGPQYAPTVDELMPQGAIELANEVASETQPQWQ